jgi:hypothetical protein
MATLMSYGLSETVRYQTIDNELQPMNTLFIVFAEAPLEYRAGNFSELLQV